MRTGALNKLTATQVRAAGDGMHSDGGGLFLRVKGSTRAWVFRFTCGGRKREMGLGAASTVTLAKARQRAAEARQTVAEGQDPIEARIATPAPRRAPAVITFERAVRRHLEQHSASWRNAKHRQQWENTLAAYAAPLMRLPVAEITAADVEACLSPIWLDKPETARRVRGRIERIVGGCIARGERTGPNPAALRDNLDNILPRQRQTRSHHAAVPVADAPAAFARIWAKRHEGAGYAALITLCLTALRSGEVRLLRWGDVHADCIAIPADRMKAGRDHDLPVYPVLADWLAELPRYGDSPLVHPGQSPGRPLSDMTPAMAMRRSGIEGTPHGWRSTFRDWAGQHGWPRELAEHQLAHAFGSEVERAYARSTLIARRGPMMEAWAEWLTSAI